MTLSRLRKPAPRTRRLLAGEIAEALFQLGGSAHRDRVYEQIVANRRSNRQRLPDRLRFDVMEAFEAYCELGRGQDGSLFTLPFGAHSHRWALRDDGARLGDPGAFGRVAQEAGARA